MSAGPDGRETPATWIVIGLGNPGEEYADTYHNVGFRVVDTLAGRWMASWSRPGTVGMIPARVAQAVVGRGVPVVLVQPWTFMNRTGRVLGPLMERFGEGASLLLVTDDLALPVGRIRIRERGSAGGHNGLKSITSALGSENYSRIRVGIGSESSGDAARLTDTKDYVLSVVRRRDRDLLERAEDLAADAVECVIREGVQSAMARFNGNDLREQRDT